MRTSVVVCRDRDGIASRALDLVIDGLRAAIRLRGEGHLALTGGSSAAALFALLRSDDRARRVDWSRVHVWQGDERFVPADHPDRNWAIARHDWLEAGAAPGAHWHPVPVDGAIAAGHAAGWAATRYASEIEAGVPERDEAPSFDVLLLGMGGDGHILSVFPGTPAITEEGVPVLPVTAPTHVEPHLERVTLSPFLLRSARSIVLMVPGAGKAGVVADCLTSPFDPRRLPAQLAIRPNAVWLLELGSAASL